MLEQLKKPLSEEEKQKLLGLISFTAGDFKAFLIRLQEISAVLETSAVQNRLFGNAEFSENKESSANEIERLKQELKKANENAEKLENSLKSAFEQIGNLTEKLEEKEKLLTDTENSKKYKKSAKYPLENSGRKKMFCDEEIKNIVELQKRENLSNYEVAKMYKCSEKTIRNYKKIYAEILENKEKTAYDEGLEFLLKYATS